MGWSWSGGMEDRPGLAPVPLSGPVVDIPRTVLALRPSKPSAVTRSQPRLPLENTDESTTGLFRPTPNPQLPTPSPQVALKKDRSLHWGSPGEYQSD